MGEAADSTFKYRHIEIKQQADIPTAQFEIRQQLRFMDWLNCVDRFELDNHTIGHQQVETVSTVQLHPFVFER